jgi:hypothetical protein
MSQKWSETSISNINALTRVTNFDEKEIKLLQEEFIFKHFKNRELENNRIVINKIDFVRLIRCFYEVLKENC